MISKKFLNLQVEYCKEKNQEKSSKRKVKNFFACLIILGSMDQSYFYFMKISMMYLSISKMISLTINGAILKKTDVIIGFFRLSL